MQSVSTCFPLIIRYPNVNLGWQSEGWKYDGVFHNSLRRKEIAELSVKWELGLRSFVISLAERNLIIGGNNNHGGFDVPWSRDGDGKKISWSTAIFLKTKKNQDNAE